MQYVTKKRKKKNEERNYKIQNALQIAKEIVGAKWKSTFCPERIGKPRLKKPVPLGHKERVYAKTFCFWIMVESTFLHTKYRNKYATTSIKSRSINLPVGLEAVEEELLVLDRRLLELMRQGYKWMCAKSVVLYLWRCQLLVDWWSLMLTDADWR